jgi:hypothetical protein
VWDARTGKELKGEPIPRTIANNQISPDGRLFAHRQGSLVDLVLLQPDEEVLSYRRLHTKPNLWRYREGYQAARVTNNEFAVRFYFNLLPLPEQEIINAEAAADTEIAAGRTEEALRHLVKVSIARAEDTLLAGRVANLQAWFGHSREFDDSCGRALESAKSTFVPSKWGELARTCCLCPTSDTTRLEAVLALARKVGEHRNQDSFYKLTLGMAEYRSGHFAEADAALMAAANDLKNILSIGCTADFYLAMNMFRLGKVNEARKLATEAAAKMKPLPKYEKNPLAGDATSDDLTLWLAYKEAKALIHFDAVPAAATNK